MELKPLDFTKRKRRKNYKNPKNTKPNKNEFESLMNELLEKFEKFEFSNLYAKTLMGNYGFLKNSLIFKTNGISKRQVYYELFPLLMLIIKDKKIFNEIEFHEIEIESIYYNNYRLYRISKVRDILNLK